MNQLPAQVGRRKYEEPNNSQAMAEWFSSGNTLQTAATSWAIRTTPATSSRCATRSSSTSAAGEAQDLKFGAAIQHVRTIWNFPVIRAA